MLGIFGGRLEPDVGADAGFAFIDQPEYPLKIRQGIVTHRRINDFGKASPFFQAEFDEAVVAGDGVIGHDDPPLLRIVFPSR